MSSDKKDPPKSEAERQGEGHTPPAEKPQGGASGKPANGLSTSGEKKSADGAASKVKKTAATETKSEKDEKAAVPSKSGHTSKSETKPVSKITDTSKPAAASADKKTGANQPAAPPAKGSSTTQSPATQENATRSAKSGGQPSSNVDKEKRSDAKVAAKKVDDEKKDTPTADKKSSVSEKSVPSSQTVASTTGTSEPKKSSGLSVFGLALLVLGAGIVGALSVTFLQSSGYLNLQSAASAPPSPSTLPSDTLERPLNREDAERLAALESDLAIVQQEVAETLGKYALLESRLEEAAQAEPAPDPQVGDLAARVSGLEQAVSSLATPPANEGAAENEQAVAPNDEGAGASIARIGNRVKDVREQLEALESTVASLETKLSGRIETATQQVDAVTSRVAGLEQTAPPADLMNILEGLAPQDDVDEINERLTNIESDTSADSAKKAALALSLADLARAAQEGKPFAAELEAIQVLTDVAAPSVNLQAFSETGMKSEDALAGAFSRLSHDILMAERAAEARTFVQQLGLGLQSMFSVREKGEVEGETTGAILARAEVRLGEQNLQGAVREMSGLAGAAADTAKNWVNEASARVEMNSFLAALSDKVLAELRKN